MKGFGFDSLYIEKMLFKVAMVLIIVGSLNWLFIGLFEFNLVTSLFGEGSIATVIYIVVGIAALSIMFSRDTYLPFLGSTVVPCSVLQNRQPPGASKQVKVIVTPNTKVLYWAAEPGNEALKLEASWKEAYHKYENAGVATSNGEGVAILKVREPQAYSVPFYGKLNPHVHYRVCGESGFMESVKTVPINKVDPMGDMKPVHTMGFADSAALASL
jgi:uncharacterized membrane protein YuzA (DUF378 family)